MDNNNSLPQETTDQVSGNTGMAKEHNNSSKKVLIIGLVFLIIFMSLGMGVLVFQNIQLQKTIKELAINPEVTPTPMTNVINSPTPATQTQATPTPDPMADWKTYSNDEYGFSIKYPNDWRKEEIKNTVGFGPQEIGEDVTWAVSYYNKSEKTFSQIKDEAGKQFSDRKQTEETINFNGITATKLITVTDQFADWYYILIIIDDGDKLYAISNGAQTDISLNEMVAKRTGKNYKISFEDFYSSFRLIK